MPHFFLCFYLLLLLRRCFNSAIVFFCKGNLNFRSFLILLFIFAQYFLINLCTYIVHAVYFSLHISYRILFHWVQNVIPFEKKYTLALLSFLTIALTSTVTTVWNPVNRRNLATIILLHASLDIFPPCLFFHVFIFSKSIFFLSGLNVIFDIVNKTVILC